MRKGNYAERVGTCEDTNLTQSNTQEGIAGAINLLPSMLARASLVKMYTPEALSKV